MNPLNWFMTPEQISSFKMSYPCGYEYLLGQQQPLHNIQLIYPAAAAAAGYSSLGQPSQSPPIPGVSLSSLVHPKAVMNTAATGAVNSPLAAVNSSPGSSSVVSAMGAGIGPGPSGPHNKKYRPPHKTEKFTPKPIPPELGNLKTYSNPDILICGNCRELFNDIVDMLEHKKIYCKMRFTCKCDENLHSAADHGKCSTAGSGQIKSITYNESSSTNNKGFQDETASHGKKVHLKCSQCKEVFSQAWDLMFHAQNAHGVNIYKLGEKTGSGSSGNTAAAAK